METSTTQRRFAELLSTQPHLQQFWDFDERTCSETQLTEHMNTLSHGQLIMAQLFLTIWFGDNRFNFDLADAIRTLDRKDTGVLISIIDESILP